MSSISLFDIISVVIALLPDPKIFLCISAYAADAAVVNPNGIKTLLANGLMTYFSNESRSLPRIPPVYIILDN